MNTRGGRWNVSRKREAASVLVIDAAFLFFGPEIGRSEDVTGEDFEHRLRKIEDWCLAHDVKCDGRDEKLVASIEAVRNSLERESAAGKITDARIDALKDEIGGMKVKLAFIAGLGAAGGGVIGSAIFKAFG